MLHLASLFIQQVLESCVPVTRLTLAIRICHAYFVQLRIAKVNPFPPIDETSTLAGETQRQDLRWQINTERQGMVARGVDDADQPFRAFVVSEDRMKEAFGLLKTLPV